MSPDERMSEDELADALAGFDESLAAGLAHHSSADPLAGCSPDTPDPLAEHREVLALLHRVWPRRRARGKPFMSGETRLLQAADELLGRAAGDTVVAPAPLPTHVGPYAVRGLLGRGGMGMVYAGWDPELQRPVALKMLRPSPPWISAADRERLSRRFAKEAQVLASLKHPHIVPIYAVVPGVQPCLVMEQVAGGSLDRFRDQVRSGGPRAIAAFMQKVASAVQYAHDRGVLHRDLKPGNILLDGAGEPLVADFGLAKLFAEPVAEEGMSEKRDCPLSNSPTRVSSNTSLALTTPDQTPGTPAYMAPEQFDPALGTISPATDVWALGVVLYELLTGKQPFVCSSHAELAEAVGKTAPARPRQGNARLPRPLETIVLRCLAKKPAERYPTPGALAKDLGDVVERGRRHFRYLAFGLGGVAVILALLIAFWKSPPQNQPREMPSPKSEHAQYLDKTAPLLERLKRGEAIELIARNGKAWPEPAFYSQDRRVLAVGNRTGLRLRGTGYGFLELLPSIPLERYRITAEVRLDAFRDDGYLWGIYCCSDVEESSIGWQRFYRALTLFRQHTATQPSAPGDPSWSYVACLVPRLYAELTPPADRVLRDLRWIQPNVENYVRRRLPSDPVGRTWWTMVIEVTPQRTTGSCTDSMGRFSLPAFPETWVSTFASVQRSQNADLAAVPGWPRPGSAVGVLLRESTCTVRSFRIEALARIPDAHAKEHDR